MIKLRLKSFYQLIRNSKHIRLLLKGLVSLKHNGVRATLKKIKNYLDIQKNSHTFLHGSNPDLLKNSEIAFDCEYQENMDFSGYEPEVKAIAFFLPQFHAIPENNEWWGEGFTEWVNTRKGSMRFPGHYQPREPHDDIGYYDLGKIETLKKQVALAKQHGIYGFCFYLYWFSGKKLLEKPVDMLLAHPEIEINFFLCWANENWTRAWDGQDREILVSQDYPENDPPRFIDDIKKYVTDKRYIRVGGKPVIIVYNPGHIGNKTERIFTGWREHSKEIGIGEILIWTCQTANNTAANLNIADLIDAEIEFPPHNMWYESINIRNINTSGKEAFLYDYQKLVDIIEQKTNLIEAERKGKPLYHTCMMGWDNAARRSNGWTTYCGFSLKSFYRWVYDITKETKKKFDRDEAFIFVNAWNEWGEGTYLEPDKKYGYANINTFSKAICGIPFDGELIVVNQQSNQQDRPEGRGIELRRYDKTCPLSAKGRYYPPVAVQIHLFYTELTDEIIENLNYIPYAFDCYVSTDKKEKVKIIQTAFDKKCNARNTFVKQYENRGRDLMPFLQQITPVIDKYEYICHIHSKKTVTNGYGNYWRKFLFKHLFGTNRHLYAIFNEFQKDLNLGLLFPETYPALKFQAGWGGNRDEAGELLKKIGIDLELSSESVFPVGNMFWARTGAIRKIFEAGIARNDFPVEAGQVNATLAHTIERSWVYIARAAGYHYKKIFNNTDSPVRNIYQNNLLLFVHFDRDNIVSRNDLDYLKALKAVAKEIVFISNSGLSENELSKVSALASKIVLRENTGYDFGAWKQVILSLEKSELEEYDHLILVNNSCYGPYRNLTNMFAEMSKKGSDFWGISLFPYLSDGSFIGSSYISEHLQSFFLVFTRKSFMHQAFLDFWRNIGLYNKMEDVIKYGESVLTKKLADAGLTYSVLVPESADLCGYLGDYSLPYKYPYQMLVAGMPFLKKKYIEYASDFEKISAEYFVGRVKTA
jgi:lipopolysaccharide biosynthesis protein